MTGALAPPSAMQIRLGIRLSASIGRPLERALIGQGFAVAVGAQENRGEVAHDALIGQCVQVLALQVARAV